MKTEIEIKDKISELKQRQRRLLIIASNYFESYQSLQQGILLLEWVLK